MSSPFSPTTRPKHSFTEVGLKMQLDRLLHLRREVKQREIEEGSTRESEEERADRVVLTNYLLLCRRLPQALLMEYTGEVGDEDEDADEQFMRRLLTKMNDETGDGEGIGSVSLWMTGVIGATKDEMASTNRYSISGPRRAMKMLSDADKRFDTAFAQGGWGSKTEVPLDGPSLVSALSAVKEINDQRESRWTRTANTIRNAGTRSLIQSMATDSEETIRALKPSAEGEATDEVNTVGGSDDGLLQTVATRLWGKILDVTKKPADQESVV